MKLKAESWMPSLARYINATLPAGRCHHLKNHLPFLLGKAKIAENQYTIWQ